MHPEWARRVRDDCQQFGVPFFFKQWGEWAPIIYNEEENLGELPSGAQVEIFNKPLKEWRSWLKDGWLRHHEASIRVGKQAAGRRLDGREWNEVPHVE